MSGAARITSSNRKPTRTRARRRQSTKSVPDVPPFFERFAARVARLAGRSITFSLAVGLVLVWALCGPLFGFSDTWQLVINTSTTILTFLMVFLIQQTQNRDSLAIQIKLAELILVAKGAKNEIAIAEEHSGEYLEKLHDALRASQDKHP